MPRTKKQTEPMPQPAAVNGPVAGEVLTLAEAAAYLRVSEQAVVEAVTAQGLPGKRIGGEWRFTKAAIQQWLNVSQPTSEMRRAALQAAAGAGKGDPDVEDVVEAIYRQRGRPITEDGSYRLFHGLNPEDVPK